MDKRWLVDKYKNTDTKSSPSWANFLHKKERLFRLETSWVLIHVYRGKIEIINQQNSKYRLWEDRD